MVLLVEGEMSGSVSRDELVDAVPGRVRMLGEASCHLQLMLGCFLFKCASKNKIH